MQCHRNSRRSGHAGRDGRSIREADFDPARAFRTAHRRNANCHRVAIGSPGPPWSNLAAMTTQDSEFNLELSRRKLLAAAGIGGGAVVAASLIGTGDARGRAHPHADRPIRWRHLRSPDCICSSARMRRRRWWCPGTRCSPFAIPRVVLGRLDGKLEQTVEAKATSYTDAKSGQVVYAYHAKLERLAGRLRLSVRRRCTTAPSRSSARSAPRRAVARRSRSPASAIRARRRSARSTCRPRA